jgi:hypothetical protein
VITRAFVILALLCTIAHADEPSPLGQAKLAIEQVRFDDAQRLLIEALEDGGNQPLAMREIYKLLGASAVALGKTDDAEKYYRAWIALEPKATLDAGASPKLRAPFDAAKSYITANGPLDVAAELVADNEVRVRVISDPLALARTVRFGASSVAIVDRAAIVGDIAGGPVYVMDRYNNTLVEVTPSSAPPAPRAPEPTPPVYTPAVPIVIAKKKPSTAFYVLAIPTGLLLATGVGFGAASYAYNGKVQTALADSGTSYYTDVVDDQKKVTTFWKLSAIIGGAGLVLAIPTTILYLRSRETTVMPFAGGGGGGVTLSGRF